MRNKTKIEKKTHMQKS